jgi:ACR3 family arsenite efflux pump ArsB
MSMNSFQFSVPTQSKLMAAHNPNAINGTINYPVVIGVSLLLFVGIPLIASLLKRRARYRAIRVIRQRQMLERIWKSRSRRPQI